MENKIIQKPCLVNTAQGFSVSYNNKFLYSKYSPAKAILQNIQNLQILPGTLFLCYSPVLPYGLLELLHKLPENCHLLFIELDQELKNFEILQQKNLNSEFYDSLEQIKRSDKISFLSLNEIYSLPQILNSKNYIFSDGSSLPKAGTFRRAVRIDFSAGIQFHSALYNELHEACTNAIMTFWSNRVTLVKFGRNYSRNFFKNLKSLPNSTPITTFFNSINKPIVIFGAGESINNGILEIKNDWQNYFILCTDTSYTSLIQNNIIPDGVFIEEAQQIISKAFIGFNNFSNKKTQIFAGLSSLSSLAKNFPPDQISFFTTKFADTDFISNLDDLKLLPPENSPFGSVGLTTVYYALKFRSNPQIPVFIFGLDFSYSAGLTHGKGTLAHITRLQTNNRLLSLQNYSAAFSPTSVAISDKNSSTVYTTHILQSYAQSFNTLFSKTVNIFDSGECGIKLEIPRFSPKELKLTSNDDITENLNKQKFNSEFQTGIATYFENEKNQLEKLRTLLTGEGEFSSEERIQQIIEIAKPREYLYLHFPDGWNFSTEISFLKRIRAEIDYFLKLFLFFL